MLADRVVSPSQQGSRSSCFACPKSLTRGAQRTSERTELGNKIPFVQRPAQRAQIQRRHFARPWYYWPELMDIVSLPVDTVSDKEGGNGGGKDAVDFSSSY